VEDLDLTLSGPQGERHEWSGGVGYRMTHDHVSAAQNDTVSFTTDTRTLHLFNAFVQDTIALSPEKWFLTLGSKFEHNDYTGFEVQPGLRLQYSMNSKHTLWSSITRAVRTPSRIESDVRFEGGTPAFPVMLQGSTNLHAENMMAYEMGYKGLVTDLWTMEVALFFNDYDDLVTNELLSLRNGMVTGFANDMSGESYGVELSSRLEISEWWSMVSAYTLQYNEFDLPPMAPAVPPAKAPRHIIHLRSQMDLTKEVQFDVVGRYVTKSTANSFISPVPVEIPGYFGLDVRLAWQPNANLELAVVGKNLLMGSHPEFFESKTQMQSTEIQRSVLGTLTWNF